MLFYYPTPIICSDYGHFGRSKISNQADLPSSYTFQLHIESKCVKHIEA